MLNLTFVNKNLLVTTFSYSCQQSGYSCQQKPLLMTTIFLLMSTIKPLLTTQNLRQALYRSQPEVIFLYKKRDISRNVSVKQLRRIIKLIIQELFSGVHIISVDHRTVWIIDYIAGKAASDSSGG